MIIYGINPINEALQSELRPNRIYMRSKKSNKRLEHIKKQAENKAIPVTFMEDMRDLCGHQAVHQGVAGEFPEEAGSLKCWKDLSELPDDASKIVVFDGIQDPHNFGAAVRVCEVFGFKHIVFHLGDSSGITAVSVKSASGAVFHVNFYCTNLNRGANMLVDKGYEILALDARGEKDIYNITLPEKYALVIGNEGKGVRHNIKRLATLLKIPMAGKVDSLNVSCALSATLSQFARPS